MEQILFLALLAVIGFSAGFLGNFISGGTSLISLSALLFIGVPPYLAVSTYAIGAIAWGFGGIKHFSKAGKIVWKLVLPLSTLGLIGAFIGANLLLATDEQLLSKIAGVLLLILIPLSLIKKDLGIKRVEVSKSRQYVGYFIYLLLTIWSGFFAAGVGIVYIYVYVGFFGLTMLESKGTSKIPVMITYISLAVTLLLKGIVNPLYLVAFVPAMFLGSSIGAKKVIQFGDERLRIVILVTIAVMSLSLIIS